MLDVFKFLNNFTKLSLFELKCCKNENSTLYFAFFLGCFGTRFGLNHRFGSTFGRYTIKEMPFYRTMMSRIDSLPLSVSDSATPLSIGWSKMHITPSFPVPSAGYGNRKGQPISVVHDSLFVRSIVLKQGQKRAAIVSCDMLIVPPEISLQLQKQLPTIGWSWRDIFIGSTHTHNSVGAWGKRYIGELFAGKYDQRIVDLICQKIIASLQSAEQGTTELKAVSFQKADANELVFNRLVQDSGTEDPSVRWLNFVKKDGRRALFTTFAAHNTTLSDTVMQFSRDYSGFLVDKLEREDGFDEAVFMAGCVGSMGPDEPKNRTDWQQAAFISDGLKKKISEGIARPKTSERVVNSLITNILHVETIPLNLREPQWRFAENWCFRHWLWSNLYGDYDAEIKVLRISDILMVGMPCDFSGELMQPLEDYAASKGKKLIVTSFNGGYVGYITKDSHYNLNKYETRTMNWFGPGNGAYFSEVVRGVIDKI